MAAICLLLVSMDKRLRKIESLIMPNQGSNVENGKEYVDELKQTMAGYENKID